MSAYSKIKEIMRDTDADQPATAVARKEIELEFTHGGGMTIPANQHLFGHVNGDFFYFTHIEFKGVRQSEEIPCRIPVKMLEIQFEKSAEVEQ